MTVANVDFVRKWRWLHGKSGGVSLPKPLSVKENSFQVTRFMMKKVKKTLKADFERGFFAQNIMK